MVWRELGSGFIFLLSKDFRCFDSAYYFFSYLGVTVLNVEMTHKTSLKVSHCFYVCDATLLES